MLNLSHYTFQSLKRQTKENFTFSYAQTDISYCLSQNIGRDTLIDALVIDTSVVNEKRAILLELFPSKYFTVVVKFLRDLANRCCGVN